ETVTLQVGGVGRPVIGKVVLPNDPASQRWDLSGGLSTKQPPPPQRPKDFDSWNAEKKQEWYNKYRQSDEYKAMVLNRKYYGVAIADDGSFRVEDVLPGVYELGFTASEGTGDRRQEWLAQAQAE